MPLSKDQVFSLGIFLISLTIMSDLASAGGRNSKYRGVNPKNIVNKTDDSAREGKCKV